MLARNSDVIVRDWPKGIVAGWLKTGRSGWWRAWTADGRSVNGQLFSTVDEATAGLRRTVAMGNKS